MTVYTTFIVLICALCFVSHYKKKMAACPLTLGRYTFSYASDLNSMILSYYEQLLNKWTFVKKMVSAVAIRCCSASGRNKGSQFLSQPSSTH